MKSRCWIWLGFVLATSSFLSFLGCEYDNRFGYLELGFMLGLMFLLYELPAVVLWIFSFSRAMQCLILSGLVASTLSHISVFSKTFIAQHYCRSACDDIESIAILHVIFGPFALVLCFITSIIIAYWRAGHSNGDSEKTWPFES